MTTTTQTKSDIKVSDPAELVAVGKTLDAAKKIDTVNRDGGNTEKLVDIVDNAASDDARMEMPVAPPCVTFEADQTSFFLKSSPDSFMYTIDRGYAVHSTVLLAGSPRPYIGVIYVVDADNGEKLKKCPIGNITLNGVSLNNDRLSIKLFGKIGKKAREIGGEFSREKFIKELETRYCYRVICEKQKDKSEATAKKEAIAAEFKRLALTREDLAEFY